MSPVGGWNQNVKFFVIHRESVTNIGVVWKFLYLSAETIFLWDGFYYELGVKYSIVLPDFRVTQNGENVFVFVLMIVCLVGGEDLQPGVSYLCSKSLLTFQKHISLHLKRNLYAGEPFYLESSREYLELCTLIIIILPPKFTELVREYAGIFRHNWVHFDNKGLFHISRRKLVSLFQEIYVHY